MLVLIVFASFIPLAFQHVAATVSSDTESDDTLPTVRITSPEKSPRKLVTMTGPASGVTLNMEGTAVDIEGGIDKLEVKVNDAATLQLLRVYSPATATGPDGEDDFSTWSKRITFDEEGTYRVCARATDEAGNLNWWHVLVRVELDEDKNTGRIAFTRFTHIAEFESTNEQIYVMNADGTNQTNISNNTQIDGNPAWSSDGTKIAFDRLLSPLEDPPSGYSEIFVMNADGTNQTRLTYSPEYVIEPTWSPDGTKLAFTTFVGGSSADISVINADGTGQTNLQNSPNSFDKGPAWSPDGARIAYDSQRGTSGEIYVMNADGTGDTNLTNSTSSDFDPAWSHDGTKIAFSSDRERNAEGTFVFEIYVMNADGTDVRRITYGNNTSAHDPSWSPDGTKIVFFSYSHITNDFEVFVINADGTGLVNVSNNPALDQYPAFGRIA